MGHCVTPTVPSFQFVPFWKRPCQWIAVAFLASLITFTTTVSPSLHTIMGPGNCPFITIIGRKTPSGLAVMSEMTQWYSRTVGGAS